jgi:uncharacterized membrane protein YdbT with pleckstrin-like domain
MRIVRPITKTDSEHNLDRFGLETDAFINRSVSLTTPEILTSEEYPVYEARPILWPFIIRPALVSIVAIMITVIAPNLQLSFIPEVERVIPLDLIHSFLRWTGVVLLAAGLLGGIIRFFRWRSTLYIVTNSRILQQTGIIGKSLVDCSLSKIQNIFLDMTILGRLFGFGTVRVATAGTGGVEIRLEYMKNPMKVHRELNETIKFYAHTGKNR